MKTKSLSALRALFCCVFFFGIIGSGWGQTLTDNGTNSAYSGGWTNGTNGGTGFSAWSLSSGGANAGHFIGNPGNNGMGTSGIGTTAFGLYGHGGHYAYSERNFSSSLAVGDILTFHWSMNWDCGSSGSKGWELRSGSTNIFGVTNTNSSTISYNGVSTGTVSSNFGTSAMLVTIQRISSTQYSVSMTRRNTADGTFTATINSTSAIDNIRIFIGSQQTNEGQRNIFFNNFQIQKPDQFRSKASGNWSSSGTWEISTDGGTTWSNASSAPGSTLYSTISVRNGHTVSQNQNYTAGSNNNIVIESGGILDMTGALGDFQFNTMAVSGSVVRNHATSNYVGAITVSSGGKYVHEVNGGSVPTCTWSSGSTFEVTGITAATSFSSGGIQSFHHVVWNCPSQTSTFSFGGLTTINGNLTVQSTGASPSASSMLLLTNSSTLTTTVSGNVSITGGYFAPFGSGTSGNCILNISGNLSLASGTFDIFRQASNTGTINLSGDFSMTSGTLTKGGSGTGNFNFSKTGTQTYSKSGGTISNAINFTVNNGSILSLGSSVIDGSTGTFTLSSGAGLITSNNDGISTSGASGSIQVSGSRTYNTGANYTFNGSSAQSTGDGFIGANNLTINNAAGVTLTSSASLAGTLTLTSGTFTVGSGNTITVSNNGSITQSSGSLASGTGAGTFTFSGTGTVSGTIGFNNVNIAGGVNFGSASTINGTLTINAGGFVNTNAPTYGLGSTLKYNAGSASAYGRSTEWNDEDASGTGYPYHVQISNNTTLNFNNGSNIPRFMGGDLTVDAGSTLTMQTLSTNSSNIGLTVSGDVSNSGIINMSTTTERLKCTNFTNNAGSTMTMSTSVGGDLEVTGNLTENGNLNSSTRAIFFTGTGTQDIQGSGTFSVDYIVLNKASGSVRMLCDLLCEGPNGGNAMTLTNTTDILDLNGYTLTLGKAGINSVMSGSGYLKTTSNSSLSILGTGNFGTINFDPSSNTIGSLTLNRTSTNAGATLGENLTATTLTITSGTLTLAANKQLTVSGTLTNNGTMTIESGATFKQGSSVTGAGTYNVKQTIDNGAGSGSTLTGRFWYLGSPLICTRSSAFGASGNLNKVWQFSNGAYSNVADGSSLSPTTGYVHRRSDASSTLTFSGQNLYAQDVTLSLSNNAGTYGGWHLVANPYTAYLDWNAIMNSGSTQNINNTYYIRSYNSSGQDVNSLISYNSSSLQLTNNSGFTSLTAGQAQYIAPLQAFWVKVNPTTPLSATAGQLRLERAFTSHQTGNVGLKNTGVYPVLARVNLYDGAKFDQMLVYMNEFMTNAVDQNDSEKMFVSGVASIYTMASGKKLVMNGLKNNKKKISVPLYLELPTSKVYQLQLSEYIMEDGLILLEDKQEGTMQDFTIHDTYAFYANSGVLSNRFVLHFFMPDATITAQGPSNSWVQDENEVNEGGSILVSSNGRGKVTIQQDIDPIAADGSQVLIRDASGRMVYEGQLEGTQTSLQLDAPSGVYFVEVQLNGQVEVKKIFVQQ